MCWCSGFSSGSAGLASRGGDPHRLYFYFFPTLRFPGAQQLVLSAKQLRALGVPLDSRDAIGASHNQLVPEHRLARLAAHPLSAFGKVPNHNFAIGGSAIRLQPQPGDGFVSYGPTKTY
jgi:hypothetical protein